MDSIALFQNFEMIGPGQSTRLETRPFSKGPC